jgi:single-strand DNA-binding protein
MFGIESAFTGRLGREPELKHVKGGTLAMLNLAVAVDEATAKEGQEQKSTWVSVKVFGEKAEAAAESLEKGAKVYVHGKLSLDSWTGNDGQPRTGLSMVADLVQRQGVGGQKQQRQRGSSDQQRQAAAQAQAPLDRHHRADDDMDQEIPF